MLRFYGVGRMLLVVVFLMSTAFLGGCTKATAPPSSKEMSKLEEQRAAAESAEKKLSDLRLERMKLEHDLQVKQAQLQQNKSELQKTSPDTAKGAGTPPQPAPVANDTAKAQIAAPAQPASVANDTAKTQIVAPVQTDQKSPSADTTQNMKK